MASSSNNDASMWLKLFSAANIPTKLAVHYARLFVEQRIQKSMLPELDKPTLREIGITAIGDQIAILKQIKAFNEMETEKVTLNSLRADAVAKQRAKISAAGPSNAAARAKTAAAALSSASATKKTIRLGRPPVSSGSETDGMNEPSPPKRGKIAPDFDVIYHVKMPVGTTPKTRQLLQHVASLKAHGIQPGRLESGVRRSGQPVAAKSTVFCRLGAAAGPETDVLQSVYKRPSARPASPEVTSTTGFDDEFDHEYEAHDPNSTLASDRLNRKKSALSRLGGKTEHSTSSVIASTHLLNRAKLTAVKRTTIGRNIASQSQTVTVRLNANPTATTATMIRKLQPLSSGLSGRLGGGGGGGSAPLEPSVKARLGVHTAPAISSALAPKPRKPTGIQARLG
uniref:SAM domain-containing protein n=1 Tax=Plectus sambesii TaxID=2011161 RepID=A0A914X7H2_9BILA